MKKNKAHPGICKRFNVGINTMRTSCKEEVKRRRIAQCAGRCGDLCPSLEKEFGAGRAVATRTLINIRERIAQKQATVTLDTTTREKGKGRKRTTRSCWSKQHHQREGRVAVRSQDIEQDQPLGQGPKAAPAATPAPAPRPAAKPAPTPAPALRRLPLQPNRSCRRQIEEVPESRSRQRRSRLQRSGNPPLRRLRPCGDADARTGTAHGFGRGAARPPTSVRPRRRTIFSVRRPRR